MTFQEILEALKKVEETELIDLLGVTSEDIVNHFEDIIEDNIDKLTQYIKEEDLYE